MTASSLALLLYAAQQLVTTIRFSNLTILGGRIAEGHVVPQTTLDRYEEQTRQVLSEKQCRSDILRAGMLVSLARVDGLSEMQDFDAWLEALRRAEAFMEFALRCQPGDSSIWMHYAGVRSKIAENPAEITMLMSSARALAPADNSLLLGRFLVWDSLTEQTLAAAAGDVDADLSTLLDRGDRCEAGAFFRAAHAPLRKRLENVMRSLPAERIKRFEAPCPQAVKTTAGPFR